MNGTPPLYLSAEQWLLVELELLLFQEQHLG